MALHYIIWYNPRSKEVFAVIQLKNVSKYYYSKGMIASGISRVNLTFDQGEFVVITGESGSGKTTLLNVISGLDSYEEGEMYIDGEETSHYLASDFEEYRKKYIGNIFQHFNLVNSYTVYQNIELILLINGYPREEVKRRVPDIIKKVGLESHSRSKVSKLSGGQKQRVAIARALAKDTDIIVADEPTGNLDSVSAEGIVQLLREISHDKLVIVVTHNYDQFARYATRKIKMHDGKVIEDMYTDPGSAPASVSAAAGAVNPAAAQNPGGTADPASVPGPAGTSGQSGPANTAAAAPIKSNSVPDSQTILPDIADMTEAGDVHSDGNAAAGRAPYDTRAAAHHKDRNITAASRIRLGIRNTFNVFPKFLLLLIVFLFIVFSVASQYTSFLNQQSEEDQLGYNTYFYNYSEDRIILKKQDKTAFTEEDFDAIGSVSNVRSVIPTDVMLDTPLYLELSQEDYSYDAFPKTVDSFEGSLMAGRMPEAENEVIYAVLRDSYYESIEDELLDKTFKVTVGYDKEFSVTVTGIAIKDQEDDGYIYSGDIYMSDQLMNNMLKETYSSGSTIKFLINGKEQQYQWGDSLYRIVPNGNVAAGKAIVSEDLNSFYDSGETEGNAKGKTITAAAENMFYTQSVNLQVSDTYSKKTFEKLTGISDYDTNNGAVYVNQADFDTLFDKGNYQVTVYVKDVKSADTTLGELRSMGYTTLSLKDTLISMFSELTTIIKVPITVIMIVAVFFIAYFVIRLILKSRSVYFSILRMLGMAKKNIRRILDVEMLLIVNIAYVLFLAFAVMVSRGFIDVEYMRNLVEYLTIRDYVILYAVLMLMAYLISGKFARSLFKKTAMGTYREEE